MGNDERLGYIEAKVGSMQEELKEFKQDHRDHMEREEKDRDKIFDKLDTIAERQGEIRNELTVYKRLFKIVLGSIVAIGTLTFGDIAKVLRGLF